MKFISSLKEKLAPIIVNRAPSISMKKLMLVGGGIFVFGMILWFPKYLQGLVDESIRNSLAIDGKVNGAVNMVSQTMDAKITASAMSSMGAVDAKIDGKLLPVTAKVDALEKSNRDELAKVNANLAHLFKKTKIKPAAPINGAAHAPASVSSVKPAGKSQGILGALQKNQARKPANAPKMKKNKK